ncbi:hypothetical protein [Microcoleus sp. herbarium2]|uniref:hypothetical protein n=1 Tax=Microcoleus sp. herbarium2 TaxID=3055433 RepID=UPI002FD1F258
MSKTMQAQLELLAEVEAVFAAKNSQKLAKTRIMQAGKLREKAEKDGSKQCFCDHKLHFYVQKEK